MTLWQITLAILSLPALFGLLEIAKRIAEWGRGGMIYPRSGVYLHSYARSGTTGSMVAEVFRHVDVAKRIRVRRLHYGIELDVIMGWMVWGKRRRDAMIRAQYAVNRHSPAGIAVDVRGCRW